MPVVALPTAGQALLDLAFYIHAFYIHACLPAVGKARQEEAAGGAQLQTW